MPRRPNRTPPADAPGQGMTIHFLPHEARWLKRNTPGPSGQLGGWQRIENWLVDHIDQVTGACALDPPILSRLMKYCRHDSPYGKGGPNQRVRDACIPALRRAGIELVRF